MVVASLPPCLLLLVCSSFLLGFTCAGFVVTSLSKPNNNNSNKSIGQRRCSIGQSTSRVREERHQPNQKEHRFRRWCQNGASVAPWICARGGSTDDDAVVAAADEPSVVARLPQSQTELLQHGAKMSAMSAMKALPGAAAAAIQQTEPPEPRADCDGDATLAAEATDHVAAVAGGSGDPAPANGASVGGSGRGDADARGTAAVTAAAVAAAAAAGAGKKRELAHLKLGTMHLGREKNAAKVEEEEEEKKDKIQWDGNNGAASSEVAVDVDGNGHATEGSGVLPHDTVWLLDYRPPPPAVSRGVDRFASLGADASKFAIFLDSAVARGELEPPPQPAAPAPIPGASADVVLGGAAVAASAGMEARRGEGVVLAAGAGVPHLSVENRAELETPKVETQDPSEATDAAAGEEEGGPLPQPPPPATAAAVATAVEEGAAAAASATDAASSIASGGGRWADLIVVSTVEVGDERANESLEVLWKQGRLLSQERDAMDVLRGGERCFSELLTSCTTRTKCKHWEEIPPKRLLEVLEGYHPEVRSLCGYDPDRSTQETLSALRTMLEWFRKEFPYYYDGCQFCDNRDNNTFVGYVYPTAEEHTFKAGRTELYHCSSCGSVSRFARYAAVSKVLETQRGRCGEYSVLMLRILEALGYRCRWVVDWSDHVWVEAWVGERWVHVDPCEAAVDEPLLYESWGKNQTYILAFTPQEVVDVTDTYTSNFEAAKARRDIDQDTVQALIADATKTLKENKDEFTL